MAEFSPTPDFNWPVEKLRAELQLSEAWGLWEREQLQAFVLWRENPVAFEIMALGTRASQRGRSLMRSLLQQVFSAHRHKAWWLEVHEKNTSARNLYLQLGFVETGRRKNYYSDGSMAVSMTLSGGGP